ncbi:hypothetical protein FA95DRAFT_1480962, partial [Auriscalpium vulgare]
MAFDDPVISLSDILQALSSNPVIMQPVVEDPGPSVRHLSPTPEPLDYAQLDTIRQRARELVATSPPIGNIPPREKEMLEMLLRITSSILPDPVQLHAQADTIYDLSQQRDMLIKDCEEERARWEAERLGFDRMAEALIVRKSRSGDTTYREEV